MTDTNPAQTRHAAPKQPGQTLPDGTRVEYFSNGKPEREWFTDGSVRTFRTDGTSTLRMRDGTILDLDPSSRPVREVTPDGTTYTTFDDQRRPTAGVSATGHHLTLTYEAEGHVVERFDDGLVVETGSGGKPVREVLPDKTEFTSFDSTGRPTKGTSPQGTPFTLSYDNKGDVVERLANGTTVVTDPNGKLVREVLPNGTVFTSFDDKGRPTKGTGPGGAFVLSYDSKGDVFDRRADGTTVVTDRNGKVIREVLPDGTVFTSFDSGGRPTKGTGPGGAFVLSYDSKGDVFDRRADGTTVVTDRNGKVIREVLPDGTVFTSFDDKGRPTKGTGPGGAFVLSYDSKGDVFDRRADGTTVVTDRNGKVIREVLPDGTVFTSFDSGGRPTKGTGPGGAFVLSYDSKGDVVDRRADGTTVVTDRNGKVIREVLPDGTVFTSFDDKGRPTRGTGPSGAFTVTYDDKGFATTRLADGTTVVTDPHGKVVREILPDGTVFDSFDSKGRPLDGYTSDGHHFKLTYDDHGDTFDHFDDGSTTEFDPNGKPIKTWTPDGTMIDWKVEIPRLHDAIGKVSQERDAMKHWIGQIQQHFTGIESHWAGPAGSTFPPLADDFNTYANSLMGLLDDSIRRMQAAYSNYVHTETTNNKNLH